MWFDDKFRKLNTEEKGKYISIFEPDDKIIIFYRDGFYENIDQDLNRRLDAEKIIDIRKFNPENIFTAVYVDVERKQFYVKRFKIETSTLNNKFFFIKEGKENYLETVTTDEDPVLHFEKGRGSQVTKINYKVGKNVEITGWRALGTRFEDYSKSVKMHWVKQKNENSQGELFR